MIRAFSYVRTIAIGLLLAGVPALAGCAPSQTFSWIDRHCFVADWTNHYSCLSCCTHGNCGPRPQGEYEMLVLGDQPVEATEAQPETQSPADSAVLVQPESVDVDASR